jgi:endonuclease/exonuclease/phosphatase family metal-dependent hydrolase
MTRRSHLSAKHEQSIMVFSLNLRFGLAEDGPNGWPHRKKSVELLVTRHASDFMAFQEANDFQTDFLKTVLEGYGCIGQRHPAPKFWQNNVLFYHPSWHCRISDHFFLSPTPDIPSRFRGSRWPRQCTIGLFERDASQIVCANTHLDFDASVQEQGARAILSRLNRFPPRVPAILTGDFNASPDSSCYQLLTGKNRFSEAVCHPFRSAFYSPFPATFHGFSGDREGKHIDWILFRGDLQPSQACVIQERFDDRYPSDHFPVFACFEFHTCLASPVSTAVDEIS